MAEQDSEQYDISTGINTTLPPGSGEKKVVEQAGLFGQISSFLKNKSGVFINSVPDNKTETAFQPDVLPEETGVGYKGANVPFEVTLVRPDGVNRVQKITGYDFLLMRRAAYREAGLQLKINSGFRSWEDQAKLYAERQAHPGLGPASPPGASGHQQGLSIDIQTGIDFPSWKTGKIKTSPTYEWLSLNAGRFGFDQHDLGRLPDGRPWEPWHWTHKDDTTIYGLNDPGSELQAALVELVNAGETAAFTSNGEPNVLRLIMKASYDSIGAWARSASAWNSDRQVHLDAAALQAQLTAGQLDHRGAKQNQVASQTPPEGFGKATLLLYDFSTGLWEDEKDTENARGV